ncbi:MAG: hypothetical protein ABGW78_03470 [Pirellulales bacterium]
MLYWFLPEALPRLPSDCFIVNCHAFLGRRSCAMRRRLLLTAVLASLTVSALAQEQKKTVRDRLQGRWGRTNHPHSFEVRGLKWFHYTANYPFKPTETGDIEYPPEKDYAIVKTAKGYVWWLFPAGDNALAAEVFNADGSIDDNADGRVFYRDGTRIP